MTRRLTAIPPWAGAEQRHADIEYDEPLKRVRYVLGVFLKPDFLLLYLNMLT